MGFSKLKNIFDLRFIGLALVATSVWAQSPNEIPKAILGGTASAPPAAVSVAAPTTTKAAIDTVKAGSEAPTRIYIPVGDPNMKKVLMAIEPTQGTTPFAREFQATLENDMDFSDLFEQLPSAKLPASTQGTVPGTFNIDPYKALGVEFLIKSQVSIKNGTVEAEVHLYDISKGIEIFGRRYPFVSKAPQPGRELGHFVSNDIVKALTGEAGIFRTRILMSCGLKTKEIYIMDFDGQNIRQLTRDRNFALSPSWAPDGHRMLFTSYKPAVKGGPLNPNLYMYDILSGQRRLISAARGLNTGGVFHPTQEKIAYTFSVKARPEIYVLDLATNTRRAITSTQFFSVEPFWSPDGSQLTYSSSQTGRPHIYVAQADGSSPKRLTFAGVYNSSPNWSPKGDRIAFSGQENMANNFNIFSIDPNGSNLVRLTDGSHSSENPAHSPDGRFIIYSGNQGGLYRIYVMTAKGTRIRALSPTSLGHCKQPAWSPRL